MKVLKFILTIISLFMIINSGIPIHYPHTLTHTHTHVPAHTGKCPEFVFSRVANLEQYLSVAGPSLLRQPRSLPSLMEAWHSLIPSHIRQRKSHTELPLLVRSQGLYTERERERERVQLSVQIVNGILPCNCTLLVQKLKNYRF